MNDDKTDTEITYTPGPLFAPGPGLLSLADKKISELLIENEELKKQLEDCNDKIQILEDQLDGALIVL